jgi:hypothetical protein
LAIHKKLTEGSILFTFHEPHYQYYYHRNNRSKYGIHFKILYVHNRRERTSGELVSEKMKETLEKLGIRTQKANSTSISAIGCRTFTYHRCESDVPYPSQEQMQEAMKALEGVFRTQTQAQGKTLIRSEFMQDFKEKKMSNQDNVFALLKPLKDYIAKETYFTY